MPTNFTHAPTVHQYHSVYNAGPATIGGNLFLVLDTPPAYGSKPVARVPATDSVPSNFAGWTYAPIPPKTFGDVATEAGDIVVAIASGTIAVGDKIAIETAAGKEGRGKKAGSGTLVVGDALEAVLDGSFFLVRLALRSA